MNRIHMRAIYVAGKMRGVPWFNFPAFDEAANSLRFRGHVVVNPAELDRAAGFDPRELGVHWDWDKIPESFDLRKAARRDLGAILRDCNSYAMIPGWESSTYAPVEKAVMDWLGLDRVHHLTGEPVAADQAESILEEAMRITSGDRQRDYDHPKPNHERIAALWNAYLSVRKDPHAPIQADQVSYMMILLKMARDAHTPKRDSLVDIAGYARCVARIRGWEP